MSQRLCAPSLGSTRTKQILGRRFYVAQKHLVLFQPNP